MRYFQPLVEHFRTLYGGTFLTLLKPSPQQEAWVGFDQGWARTTVTTHQLFQNLSQAVHANSSTVSDFYLGFFLQFKVVDRMVRKSKVMPDNYVTPYLRAALSLEPNQRTGLSQHETLLRLANVPNASVFYTCPMLFDIADIWRAPTIDDLRFVGIKTAPSGWATNQQHYIMFQDETDLQPLWKSEPVKTKAFSTKQWSDPDNDTGPRKLTGKQLASLIESSVHAVMEAREFKEPVTQFIPPAFTIMKFGYPNNTPDAIRC
jgi:hypothetical protein